MKSCKDGEEVLPRAGPPFRISVREVVGHLWHLQARIIELAHRDLVVVRRVSVPHLRHLEQLLVATEDLLEVISRDHLEARHEVLP